MSWLSSLKSTLPSLPTLSNSSSLLLDISSSNLRVILTTYFKVLPIIVSWVGSRSCENRVKLKILKDEDFHVAYMTGWLTMTETFEWLRKLWVVPCGWLGYVMFLSGLLWVVSDYAVTGLVVDVGVVSRCPFDTTGPFAVIQAAGHTYSPWTATAPFGETYRTITQARVNSINNGGLAGIYKKVNNETNFRADPVDVWGQWECEDLNQTRIYPGNETSADLLSIIKDMQSQGLLYNNEAYSSCAQTYPDGYVGLSLIWSNSVPVNSSKPWQFRGAVDVSTNHAEQQTFKLYHCHLDAPALQPILAQTIVAPAIQPWCTELRGHIYANDSTTFPSFVGDPVLAMEALLDGVVMGAGVAQIPSENGIADPTQGCLATRARVPWPVILAFLAGTGLTVLMAVHWIVLVTALRGALRGATADSRLSEDQIEVLEKKTLPGDYVTWMLQAVCETGYYEEKLKGLAGWSFGFRSGWQHPGMLKRDGSGAEDVPVEHHFPRQKDLH